MSTEKPPEPREPHSHPRPAPVPESDFASESIGPPVGRRETAVDPIFFRREYLAGVPAAVCHAHPETAPQYICPECGLSYCAACANLVGRAQVKVCECQGCGALCRTFPEVRIEALRRLEQFEEYGLADLKFAAIYPKDLSLLPMIVFSLLLGFSYFGVTFLLAVAVLFSCVAYAIKDVANGSGNGAHTFDISSLFADLVNPLVIGMGTLIVTFGPLFLLNNYLIGYFAPLRWLVLPALGWALFYYPTAMMVAGLTGSFSAVLNLKIGFQTMKTLGNSFWIAFGFYLGLVLPLILLPSLLLPVSEIINNPLMLAFFGVILGVPIFYVNMVVAAVLGRALYKSADQVGISFRR